MNIWAGIKYAINSTLGTDEFKPLNEQIDDFANSISLTASDSTIKTLVSSDNLKSGGGDTYTFTPNFNGNIRIKLDRIDAVTSRETGIRCINNLGQEIGKIVQNIAGGESMYLDVDVSKSITYMVEPWGNSGKYRLSICGQTIIGIPVV